MVVLVDEAIAAASISLLSSDDEAAEVVARWRAEIGELHASVETWS